MNKQEARLRRSKKSRSKMKELEVIRLCVHRTPRHIYAQLIDPKGAVLAAVSTLTPDVRKQLPNGGNISAATLIGEKIAEAAKKVNVTKVAFDRSGFRYHGRLKALADGARKGGLEF